MSESERPGRYPRTTNGLVAALVVTVVAVVGVIGLMALFRDEPDIKPEEVDYLETVGLAQDADIEPVYPAELPEGWIATRAEVLPDAPPGFDLALLTDDEEFVGLVWSGEPIEDLLAERVDDEDVEDADPFTAQESVARSLGRVRRPGRRCGLRRRGGGSRGAGVRLRTGGGRAHRRRVAHDCSAFSMTSSSLLRAPSSHS